MGDLPAVASCLPGARVESQEGERVKGSIAIKFGPMSAAFAGAARLERDEQAKRAVLRGAGQDSLSKSRAQGDIAYQLQALSAQRTRVQVDMLYALQGPLAQFSRSGLVKDFVRRMVADFGTQVTRRLGGADAGAVEARALSLPRMMWDVLWSRLRRLWSRQ
jgi:carbon-monoxide dehydrogenase small subunit